MSRICPIYATREDILGLMRDVEERIALNYVIAGMFDKAEHTTYCKATEIPDLGISRGGDTNLDLQVILAKDPAEFVMERVPQRKGGVRYSFDQVENPNTVVISAGGQFDETTVIAGSIGTCKNTPESVELFKLLKKMVRKRFVRIRSYYVGPDAKEILDAGGRLTTGISSPSEYDLHEEVGGVCDVAS